MVNLSAVSDGVENLPRRPLLFATGAAAMAAGIYFYMKRVNDRKKMTVDSEDTNAPEGPVYDQAPEPVQLTEVRQDQMTVSLARANGEYQNGMETVARLEAEMFILTNQVDTLKDTVKEMRSQLCEELKNPSKSELNQIVQCQEIPTPINEGQYKAGFDKKLLLKKGLAPTICVPASSPEECEQVPKARRILQGENNELKETLMQQQELWNIFQTEAEENSQMAMQTIAKLEEENSDLTNQVMTLRDTVKGIGNQLYDSHRKCHMLINEHRQEQGAYCILQAENDELKKTIQLMKNEKITKECEQVLTAHSTPKMEKDEMKTTLTHKQESLKATANIVSLAGAKEKCQKAVQTIAQLETEKSFLTNEVKTLKDSMQNMGNQL